MRRRPRRFRNCASLPVGVLALALLVGGMPVRAQNSAEQDPLNHAFAVYLGSGIYVSNGNQVYVFRIAPKIRIRNENEHAFGVRFRINATLGFYNFDPKDLIDLEFPDRASTYAIVPGVDFPIKIYESWTLYPFVDFGPAIDDIAREVTLVFGVGSLSRAEFHDDHFTYVLWNELIYAANKEDDQFPTDDFSVFRTQLDVRELVKFRALQRQFDLGILFGNELYFNRLIVQAPDGETFEVKDRWEIGFTVGASEPWKPLKKLVKAPRLGVGYRFGDGPNGVRFILRFRY